MKDGLQIQGGRSVVVVVDHALIEEVGSTSVLSDSCCSISFCNAEKIEIVVDKLCKSSGAALVGQRDGVLKNDLKLDGLAGKGIVVISSSCSFWSPSVGQEVGSEGLVPENLELRTVDGVERRINVHRMKKIGSVTSVKLHSVGLKVLNDHHAIAISIAMFVTGVTAKNQSTLNLDLSDGNLETNTLRR